MHSMNKSGNKLLLLGAKCVDVNKYSTNIWNLYFISFFFFFFVVRSVVS